MLKRRLIMAVLQAGGCQGVVGAAALPRWWNGAFAELARRQACRKTVFRDEYAKPQGLLAAKRENGSHEDTKMLH